MAAGEWYAALSVWLPCRSRHVHPDDLHVTLAFLGDCSEGSALAAWEVARATPPPLLLSALTAPSSFGDGRAYDFGLCGDALLRSWIDLHRPEILQAAGAGVDRRCAEPHVTVAWSRATTDGKKSLWAMRAAIGTPVSLDHVALYSRAIHRGEDGRRYRQIARHALADAGNL